MLSKISKQRIKKIEFSGKISFWYNFALMPQAREIFPTRPRAISKYVDRRDWSLYDSTFQAYLEITRKADPEDAFLEGLRNASDPVAIDVMASTSALVSLRDHLALDNMRGLAVAFSERRGKPRRKAERLIGIEQLNRDLKNPLTFDAMDKWLGERKAQLVIERGAGGLHHVPTECSYYLFAVGRLWQMVDPNGGALVLQTPAFLILERRTVGIVEWLSECRKRDIDVKVNQRYTWHGVTANYGLVVLRKEDPSQELPMVSARNDEMYKRMFERERRKDPGVAARREWRKQQELGLLYQSQPRG